MAWGGAVAAFEMSNVSVTGCSMVENSALAAVPVQSQQYGKSQNAVAGGGCVSVLFRGNSSACTVRISGNTFLHCTVHVSSAKNILVGNGYGGAVSVNFGVSAGLQLLSVSFVSVALQNNVFANCVVRVSVSGGNAYGGAVAFHIGAYSSVNSRIGDAVAAVGDTVVRIVSVLMDTARFESCEAVRESSGSSSYGANVYGGSCSFHVGSYAWSRSDFSGANSISTCGSTTVTNIRMRFRFFD